MAMKMSCKACRTPRTLVEDDPIPKTCPTCGLKSETLEYSHGEHLTIRTWFYREPPPAKRKPKKKKN